MNATRPGGWQLLHISSAVVVAALVPALISAAVFDSVRMVPAVFLVALANAVILGVPLIAVLWAVRKISLVSSLVAGFSIGAAGVAVVSWPSSGLTTNSSIDGVAMVVDGVPTAAGWLNYLEGVVAFGALGAVGALSFWLWLQLAGVLAPPGHRRAGWGRNIGMPLAVAAAVAAIFSIPAATADRTCHNVLRDGRTSIHAELRIDMDIADDDWPELANIMRSFAATHGMDFRDNSEIRPGLVSTLYLSACNAGVTFNTAEQRWASKDLREQMPGRGVGIGLYLPAAEAEWQVLARDLLVRLEAAWPGKVRFRDEGGRISSAAPDFVQVVATIPAQELRLGGVAVGEPESRVTAVLGAATSRTDTGEGWLLSMPYTEVLLDSDGVVEISTSNPAHCTPAGVCPGTPLQTLYTIYGDPMPVARPHGHFFEYVGHDASCWLQVEADHAQVASLRIECQP